MELVNLVFRNGEPHMGVEHGYVYCLDNAENMRIMLADGVPVSHYGTKLWEFEIFGVQLLVGSVGGVCTHPDFRGRGLATRLLADAEDRFRQSGVDLVFISGSRGLYLANGHAKAGKSFTFDLDQAAATGIDTRPFALRSFAEKDLTALERLYNREPARFRRPTAQWPGLMAGRLARKHPDQFFIVAREEQDVAWFDIQTHDNMTVSLWDYAGDRAAVLAGLAMFLAEARANSLSATVLWHDEGLLAPLRALGLSCETGHHLGHTIKLLDFAGFMRKMTTALREKTGAQLWDSMSFDSRGHGAAIVGEGEQLVIADSRLVAKLVFGSADGGESGLIASAPARIAEFVKRAFPIPLVRPGLNYV